MGVHIMDATLTVVNGCPRSPLVVEASAGEVRADGAAGGPARALAFCASVLRLRIACRACRADGLLEASCSLHIEGTVKADGPLNVEVNMLEHRLNLSYYLYIRKSKCN